MSNSASGSSTAAGKISDPQVKGNKHYDASNAADPATEGTEQGFVPGASGSVDAKSQARQRDEEYLEPNRKAEPQAEKGDTKFQSQVDKQHADAQSKGAASLASEKEKLQKDVFSSHTDAANNRADTS